MPEPHVLGGYGLFQSYMALFRHSRQRRSRTHYLLLDERPPVTHVKLTIQVTLVALSFSSWLPRSRLYDRPSILLAALQSLSSTQRAGSSIPPLC